ncbi:uncharacterized protein LOC107849259 [Capsicum annuum]|uniref:uncharacterized protein LOC107849259 n=1 Tax=Capsicum annuum TaxID=4072 RepID=UPI001FB147E7|nr:uncharacterized protein LOC107849259 [Capsicum annuum]
MVSSIRARIRKFTSDLSRDLILESEAAVLIKYMDILRLVVYMQQVEKEKKKWVELGKRQGKRFIFSDQGGGQQLSGRDGGKWPKKSRAILGLIRQLVLPTQSYRGFCVEEKDKYFNCSQVGYMLRNYLIGKVASGANNVLVASSLDPSPKGVPSGFDTDQNSLYALTTRKGSEASPDVVNGDFVIAR